MNMNEPQTTTTATTNSTRHEASNNETPPAASAVTLDRHYALTVQALDTLRNVFSFPAHLAQLAIDECGPEDVQACYNWILDNHPQVEDRGGPVVPKEDCPHLAHHLHIQPKILDALRDVDWMTLACQHYDYDTISMSSRAGASRKRIRDGDATSSVGRLKCEEHRAETDHGEIDNEGTSGNKVPSCPKGEHWLCLECGIVLCSRYANGHAKLHWQDTKAEDHPEEAVGKAGMSYGAFGTGHCVAVSLADLSVWCYECNNYLQHPMLEVLTKKLENLKWGPGAGEEERDGEPGKLGERIDPAEGTGTGAISIEEVDNSKVGKDGLDMDRRNVGKRKGQPKKLGAEQVKSANYSHVRDADVSGGYNLDNIHCRDSDEEGEESDHHAAILASLIQGEHSEAILAYLSRHTSFDPGDMGQCVPMHMPAPPSFPDEMADFLRSPLCKSIVVLAGAGMSVSSGIPDFRSAGVGLYDTLRPELLTAGDAERELIRGDPTLALDKGMFLRNPLPLLELKRDFILGTSESRWKATIAHRFVELLHTKLGKLTRLYTQNIDGLELQCKGLPKKKIVNVHGSMGRAACELCETEVDFQDFCGKIRTSIKDISGRDTDAPGESTPIVCDECGRPAVKPTIVLFRGSMPKEFHKKTALDLGECDLLIIMGTSLSVAPANSLVYRVPPTCLRMVINDEKFGRGLGIDYSENSVRDVFAHGHSDEICLQLMETMGWLEDVAAFENDLPENSARLLRERIARRDFE